MKIVFLTRRFYPDIGGVEKHVLEISKRLQAKGHHISIITESQKTKNNILGKLTVYRLPKIKEGKKKKFLIWKWLWKNRQILENADILHCHDVFFWYLPFRFFYPQKPVFTTFHGYESYPIKKKAIVVRKISELLSFGNICIGEFMKKWYFAKPDIISYGAVDVQKIKSQKSNHKKNSALFIGRLDEQTGILTYMEAFEQLRKKDSKFELVVIGDGKYKKRIEKKVKVLGFKKDPENYFSKFHFAFVSRYLSILEAFAAKKLVFASYDNPIKKDYLQMAPFANFIISAKNADELSRKVQYFLSHPKQEKRLVDAAFSWVQKQSWDQMLKNYLSLWKEKR